jgi:toxin ParE1/3/4
VSLEISISRRAEDDLTRQYKWYLDKVGLEVAEQYLLSVDETIHYISRFPSAGRLRLFNAPELSGVRSKTVERPFGVHLVFYRIDEEHLFVDRILHGSRDLASHLF